LGGTEGVDLAVEVACVSDEEPVVAGKSIVVAKLMVQYGEFLVPSQCEVEPMFVLVVVVVMIVELKATVVAKDGETTATVSTNKYPACDHVIGQLVVACSLSCFGG
jgi:hypothetical protein